LSTNTDQKAKRPGKTNAGIIAFTIYRKGWISIFPTRC